uniref:Protein kinase domain-containing protein n=1 Tax=Globisporangium ultimum (strain ATCC 200006 / CBS 805.95 / DAOM BR144) TaxID=431595 RepID=K3X6H8_GLOUD
MGICGSSQGGAFRKLYELDEKTVLSERRGATVFRGRHRASGALVAIKRVDKPMPQDAKSPSIPPHSLPPLQLTPPSSWENEVAILQQCAGHKHIIAFRTAFEMPTHALLVMEYVEGGELFDALISDGAYSEWDAKRFVHDILQALAFLHARNIIHRDIKPENLVFTSRDSKVASIKVVNFAMAKRVYHESTDGDDQLTWPYCAPEILASFGGLSSRSASRSASMAVNAHDTADTPVLPTSPPPVGVKCDMWSVGIVLYVLLSGAHPFDLDGRQPRDQIVGNILLGKFTMSDESPVWRQISSEAKDFLRKLLQVDPEKRLSAEEALAHKWFMAPDTPRSPLSVSVSDGLGQYQRLMRKKFR